MSSIRALTDAGFERRLKRAAWTAAHKAAQNPAQSVHAESRTDSHEKKETAAPLAFAGDTAVLVPPRGVEESQFIRRKPRAKKTATPNPTPKARLPAPLHSTAILAAAAGPEDWVRKQIATLPPEVITALWAIFRSQNGDHSPEEDRS
jgi:hypothetical protein